MVVGTIAVAGPRVLGGSNTLKRKALQYLKSEMDLNFSGKAKYGRYGTPGSGVYPFCD